MSTYSAVNRDELRQLITNNCINLGNFTLKSGRQSDWLLDLKKIMLMPQGADLLGQELTQEVKDHFPKVTQVAGVAVGGVPLVTAVVLASTLRLAMLTGFYVRAEAKDHGTGNKIDGSFLPGVPAVLLEDVTTTGGSSLAAIDVITAAGGLVAGVISVVDRSEGAAEAFAARSIPFRSLYTRSDFRPA